MRPSLIAVLPPAARIRQRIREILPTGLAQIAIQMIGFLTGLIVIRMLPVHEYAYYTIVNAGLGTMTVLTDSGISQSVLAEGAKVWQSPRALGGVIAAGMILRRRFALLAVTVTIPILYEMLRRQGADALTAVLTAASIVPMFAASLTTQLLQVVPRLHQRLMPLQRVLISSSVLRLVLTAGAGSLFPLAWLVSTCAGIAQNWTSWRTRLLMRDLVDLEVGPDASAKAAIIRLMRRSSANAIYYAFEGQLTVWLISIFGKVQAVAQVGALNRLTMGFSVLGAVFSLLWAPRFARLRAGPVVLAKFWSGQGLLCGVLLLVIIGVASFPHAALILLGRSYESLTREVVLSAIAAALGLLAGCAYLAAASRGIVISPWFMVPFALSLQCVLILLLPVSTVAGLLWLSIGTNLAFWCCHSLYFTWKFMKTG
jgi:O-antigen/teichoic acid export membrane protein